MFAEPLVSRGKKKKHLDAKLDHGVGGACTHAAGKSDKKRIQRAAKSQRKFGGLSRGGLYEVEELGELYTHGGELSGAVQSKDMPETSDDDDDDDETGRSSFGATRKENEAESTTAVSSSYQLPTPHSTTMTIPGGSVAEDELRSIEDSLRRQLRAWATDPSLPLDEQRRFVRQLLAQWHPDKNQHIGAVATHVFQFIQDEVNRVISDFSQAANQALKKEVEARERRAQRAAEKQAKASALRSAREDKLQGKKKRNAKSTATSEAVDDVADAIAQQQQQQLQQLEPPIPDEEREDVSPEPLQGEWSLVVGHGPATTHYLRPWPRSHLTLTLSPVDSRSGEVILFGGEAYDGRELTFFSDMYRLNLHGVVDSARPLPWEKIYSSAPLVPGPEPRSSHQAVAWEKHLYVFGGEWSSRDQRRYRQFGDLWRIDVTGGPGTRWERITTAASPVARSGHRMTVSSTGRAMLFGGFTEDKKRRASYLDDFYVLQLPASSGATWLRPEPPPRVRGGGGGGGGGRAAAAAAASLPRPSGRAGGLLWAGSDGSAYVFGGARPRKAAVKKKGGNGGGGGGGADDSLIVLEDLWRARFEELPPTPSSSSSSALPSPPSLSVPCGAGSLVARWERLEVQGQGPGPRTGLCHCAISSTYPGRRLVFGGVIDVPLAAAGAGDEHNRGRAAEVSVFHQDVFLLDCEMDGSPTWSRLWPPPTCNWKFAASLSATVLPSELQKNGGGVDAQSIVLASRPPGPPDRATTLAPRGRIAATCAVMDNALWVFGGACESGPKREVTLDDLWRLELVSNADGQMSCRDEWECILPLSERATLWFDSESDEDESDDSNAHAGNISNAIVAASANSQGTLAKKQQKEADKKARMELKRERQQEKCEDKTNKREMKKERQRTQARDAT